MTPETIKEFESELNALLEKYDTRFNGDGDHSGVFPLMTLLATLHWHNQHNAFFLPLTIQSPTQDDDPQQSQVLINTAGAIYFPSNAAISANAQASARVGA